MSKLNSLNTLNYRKYTGDLPEPVVGVESNTGKDANTTYRIQFGQGEQSPPDPLLKRPYIPIHPETVSAIRDAIVKIGTAG